MPSFGSRRGNPALRSAVDQAARRRLWAALEPDAGEPASGPDALAAACWSRGFFDRIRAEVFPRMAPALAFEGAELRYFGGEHVALWALQAAHELVLAVECLDTPASLLERARRWRACLRTRTSPGLMTRSWGRPVYGARLDPLSDELDVVWATPGDWCGIVLGELPAPRHAGLPAHWGGAGLAPA